MVKRKHSRRQRQRQRGGSTADGAGYGNYGYEQPVQTASGAPFAAVTPVVSHLPGDFGRPAPSVNPTMMSQFGGRHSRRLSKLRQRSRRQRGGCGCMAGLQSGGGAATGGHTIELTNDLGKVHAGFQVYPCPSAPVENSVFATQMGGAAAQPNAAQQLGVISYKAGYGYEPSSVVETGSAQYLKQIAYPNVIHAGGARRKSRRRGRKSQRK